LEKYFYWLAFDYHYRNLISAFQEGIAITMFDE